MKYININSSTEDKKYVYHIVDGETALKTLKKYGLCSPKALWDTVNERVDTDLIINLINRYKERTLKFKNINEDEIAINDVLDYLDNGRPPLTSECIFWSFISVKDMPYINNTFKGTEIRVDLDTLKRYSTGNPIIVLGKKETSISWSKLEKDYDKFVEQAATGASKDPGHKLRYKKIVHLAVPSQIIPFSQLQVVGKKREKITASSASIPYNDIDVECRNLVKALNKLPGIKTLESCCGHGKEPYRIFLYQEDNASARGLAFLGKLMSRRYHNFSSRGWTLTLHEVTDTLENGDLLLEGPIGEEAYSETEQMAQIIEEAIKENMWPLKKDTK